VSGTGIGWHTPLHRPSRSAAGRRKTRLAVSGEAAPPQLERAVRRWPLWIGLAAAVASSAAIWMLLVVLLISAVRAL
jgi:hypothetical protein